MVLTLHLSSSSLLSHDHVVGFRGACIEHREEAESVFVIVTELMEFGKNPRN